MITVLCPTYNEAEYIEKVLKFFINAKPTDKELIIIDGCSNDETKEIVNDWTNKKSNIRLLENEIREKGLNLYGLSVRKDNKEAIGFYNQNGYKVEFENSKSIYYIKEI